MTKYNIGWGITSACNMKCKFCYSKDRRSEIKNIGIKDWVKFVDENHEMIDSINYGTGENVICDDFFIFVEYVRNNYPEITQALTTNGYIYERVSNNKRYYEIYKKCIDEIDVSLDFYSKTRHNFFRGQPKAYDWAINTLDMLNKDGKKATIVFVGFDETLEKKNIDGLFKIAKKYNAMLRVNVYRPVSNSEEINLKFIVNYNKLKDALEYINDKYKILSLNDSLFGNIYSDGVSSVEHTGINSIRILPDGSICPSTYLIAKEYSGDYNIKQSNVLSKIKFEQFINAPIPKDCKGCKIRNKCRGGVYDRRILWYGSLKERDPYCPFKNGDKLSDKRFEIHKTERVSVHDGYLPTMFFTN